MNTIRRSDAIDALIKEYPYINPTSITNVIMHVEDAEPERKTGRWEIKTDPYEYFDEGIPVCSCCGCTNTMRLAYNFCPNCGSPMEVEHETD